MSRLRSVRLVLGVACTLALFAASCGDDSDGGTAAGSAPSAADLDGSTFTVTEVEGQDLVADTTFTLTFEDGAVVAQAGCNTLRGGYELDGGELTAGPLASTMMACEDDLMAQDQWIAEFLESGPTLALDGDVLTLTTDDVTITAEREA